MVVALITSASCHISSGNEIDKIADRRGNHHKQEIQSRMVDNAYNNGNNEDHGCEKEARPFAVFSARNDPFKKDHNKKQRKGLADLHKKFHIHWTHLTACFPSGHGEKPPLFSSAKKDLKKGNINAIRHFCCFPSPKKLPFMTFPLLSGYHTIFNHKSQFKTAVFHGQKSSEKRAGGRSPSFMFSKKTMGMLLTYDIYGAILQS